MDFSNTTGCDTWEGGGKHNRSSLCFKTDSFFTLLGGGGHLSYTSNFSRCSVGGWNSVFLTAAGCRRNFGLAIHQNDLQARRRFVEWAQNEIDVVPDFHKRILFSDEAHFWLNGYVNKQNCHIWSEANPQVYVETPLHPEKLTVWCALWAGGILLQKR
ncbi:putative DD41D transposase [Trichonephila clavipes]|nr:putative DD41D transposase [Trichonephila clavipes]